MYMLIVRKLLAEFERHCWQQMLLKRIPSHGRDGSGVVHIFYCPVFVQSN